MSQPGIVIVGAGQGGLQAAISLRQEGYAGPVTLIGAEPGLPYQRPPLSKAYLADGDAEALILRPQSFFQSKDITYLPLTKVEKIDRAARQVVLNGPGTTCRLNYDRLILAMGARNLRPPIAGLERALDLRMLADAARLREALSSIRRVAVIGGGFIGLEFAAAARKLGHHVTVIEAADRLMARAVSAPMSRYYVALHHEWGVALCMGQAAVQIEDSGVRLADGAFIRADMVLLAAGVTPNVELAQEAGLEVGNGVHVDAHLRTSDHAIFALGDCTSFSDPRSGRRVRLESVQAATDQARLIASQIAQGTEAAYTALPWFWSEQGDRKLQIAGLAGTEAVDEVIADGIVARLDAIGVAAVEAVNNPGAHIRARRMLAGQAPVTLEELKVAVLKHGTAAG